MVTSRPKDEKELQRREAIGVIRASRFVRVYNHSHKPITIATISLIHHEIFSEAWPEIAGVYRHEDLAITDSEHIPPHHSDVQYLMGLADIELAKLLEELKDSEGVILAINQVSPEKTLESIEKIVHAAAWLHHTITFIHPYREGNGRTARLASNLILERYGLVGISVKIEKENKNAYRKALAQIDKHKDYEPLEMIIYEGISDRYDGVAMRYYSA